MTYSTENDAFISTWSPGTTSRDYVPGLQPTYFVQMPQEMQSGPSAIAGCSALGYRPALVYASNGEHYKLIYHCASETASYPTDVSYYDPARPNWAWAVSDNMDYTTFVLGW